MSLYNQYYVVNSSKKKLICQNEKKDSKYNPHNLHSTISSRHPSSKEIFFKLKIHKLIKSFDIKERHILKSEYLQDAYSSKNKVFFINMGKNPNRINLDNPKEIRHATIMGLKYLVSLIHEIYPIDTEDEEKAYQILLALHKSLISYVRCMLKFHVIRIVAKELGESYSQDLKQSLQCAMSSKLKNRDYLVPEFVWLLGLSKEQLDDVVKITINKITQL